MNDTSSNTGAAAEAAWLDADSTSASPAGTLYGAKGTPAPPGVSTIRGTDGDDTLHGSVGSQKFYGGKGQDTVVYRGAWQDYELRFRPEAWDYELVDKVSGRDGTDLLNLHDVERLQFSDQVVLLDDWGGARLADGTPVLGPHDWVPPSDPAAADETGDAVDATWLDTGTIDPAAGTLYGPKGTPVPAGASIVCGTDGDDTLHGSEGSDKFYGGKGQDTVVYRGAWQEYELRFRPEAWDYELVDKVSGRGGTDWLNLHDVERLQFSDQVVLLDDCGGARLQDGTLLLAPYFGSAPECYATPDDMAPQDNGAADNTGLVGVPPAGSDAPFAAT